MIATPVRRRAVVAGTAWAVPAVAVASLAPATAASAACPTCLTTSAAPLATLDVTDSAWSSALLSLNLPVYAPSSCLTHYPGLAVALSSATLSLGVPAGNPAAAATWTMTATTGTGAGSFTTLGPTTTIPLTLSNLTPGPQPPAPNASTYTDLPGTGILSMCLTGTVRYTPAGTGSPVEQGITLCVNFCAQGTRTFKQLGNGKVSISYTGATTCASFRIVSCS